MRMSGIGLATLVLAGSILLGGCLPPAPELADRVGDSLDPRPTPTMVDPGPVPATAAPTVAQSRAPDFTLPDLAGGTVRLADLRGQVVLLNFWTTW